MMITFFALYYGPKFQIWNPSDFRYDLLDFHGWLAKMSGSAIFSVPISGYSVKSSRFWVVLALGTLRLHMLQKLHTFTTKSGVLFSFFPLESQSNKSMVCDFWGSTIALIAGILRFNEILYFRSLLKLCEISQSEPILLWKLPTGSQLWSHCPKLQIGNPSYFG
jgi:hypothetical protein